jgi:phosphatidylinositol-3-phosphatase
MRRAPRDPLRGRLAILLPFVIAIAVIAVAAWVIRERAEHPPVGTPVPAGSPFASAAGGHPIFGHVYLIVLENRGYDRVVNGTGVPYLQSLIAEGGLATAYHAVSRPSQPNYIALFSGDVHGIDDDQVHDIDAANLADQLEGKGRSWSVSAENLPNGCFTGATASDGRDGPGTYARKHEPAISFLSISRNPARCARIHDMTAFDPAEADFQLIVPNLCNDAHDCPLATADTWLSKVVPRILDSDTFKKDGLLVVTFDEADSRGGTQVALVAVGQSVRPGTTSDAPTTHYSLLRTIEDNWGLGCIALSCSAPNLGSLFTAP